MKNKKEKQDFEKLNNVNNNKNNVSQNFYYLLTIILSIVLIFATEEFLGTINYLFVVIFAVIAVIKILNFILEKNYEKRDYSDIVIGIISLWLAIFIFRYGQFLFVEMLPVLVSLILFMIGLSSFIKYFNNKIKGNLLIGITSLIFGILLLTLPLKIMYICFKIVGIYLLVIVILDLIDYKKNIRN